MSVERLRLRPATAADSEPVLEWRNLPEIVALGTSRTRVAAAEHARWFADALRAELRVLLIVELEDQPIGTVRYDALGDRGWEVSVYLLAPHRGRGLGSEALVRSWELMHERGAEVAWAFVRDDNPRSVAAFQKAGFELVNHPDVDVPPSHHALRLTAPVANV